MSGSPLLDKLRAYSLSGFFVSLGITAIILALRIPKTGFQSEYDPGPAAVPALMGLSLTLGGLYQGLLAWRRSETTSPLHLKAFWILAGGLVAYAVAMPSVGFALSTVTLVTWMATWLGSRWWVSLLFALGIVLLVQILFGQLFKVPLPQGVLGLPF